VEPTTLLRASAGESTSEGLRSDGTSQRQERSLYEARPRELCQASLLRFGEQLAVPVLG
jgi:hypothetical protein